MFQILHKKDRVPHMIELLEVDFTQYIPHNLVICDIQRYRLIAKKHSVNLSAHIYTNMFIRK